MTIVIVMRTACAGIVREIILLNIIIAELSSNRNATNGVTSVAGQQCFRGSRSNCAGGALPI